MFWGISTRLKILSQPATHLERQLFTSRMTSVLTLLGVAIGLGNVWRFPYMMGKYGGSAFLGVYLLLTLLFAFPALVAEMTLGRMSGNGTLDALRLAFGKRYGGVLGFVLLGVVSIAGSYYAVVVGNVVFTTIYSGIAGFSQNDQTDYQQLLSMGWIQYGITLTLIILSLYIIYTGLIAGIERISKLVMPLFFLALVYMIFHALTLPGAIDKCLVFLKPDFSVLGMTEIFAAMGQAFFSVGLGGTFVVVYSGFLRKDENIPKVALFTGMGDAGASLLFSLFLIPSMLVFGLDMASGPSLIFNTFPKLFGAMPGGRFVGTLFLLSISIVAFLSLVAAYQVPFTSIQHEKSTASKKEILIVIGLVQAVLALPSSLFPEIIGTLDLFFGSGMQVLGSALCIIGLTWRMRKPVVITEMFLANQKSVLREVGYFWIKWIIPLALLAVLVAYLYDVIF
jgi:NSS family neurotransmitter:Na+ symporter